MYVGGVAQLGERLPCTQEVIGSNPFTSTSQKVDFDCSLTTEYEVMIYDQATKGKWWMPWRQEAMKDVVSCDKPRGAAKQAVIRGFPNGATHPG